MLSEGVVNPHLKELEKDFLYHLGLDSSMDLKEMFGDVKFVCMGGSHVRAESFAKMANEKLGMGIDEHQILPLGKTERFSLYKIGPMIFVNHGMGMPSMSILLNELAKLLHYAGAKECEWIRVGTSGGVGVKPGTAVVANEGLNGVLEPYFETIVLGERRKTPARVDARVADGIFESRGKIKATRGKTMGTDGFYEEQGRLDGALDPGYTEQEKLTFLKKLYSVGGRNIEMESTKFLEFCHRAGIPAAVVCTALLNRLEGDQVTSTPDQLKEFSDNAQMLVLNYIKEKLSPDQLKTGGVPVIIQAISEGVKRVTTTFSKDVIAGKKHLQKDEAELYEKAYEFLEKADAPHSHFEVAVAVLFNDGTVRVGNNQETCNYDGVCAEREALAWSGAKEKKKVGIKKMLVIGRPEGGHSDKPTTPCGRCRQLIREWKLPNEPMEILAASTNGPIWKYHGIDAILPDSFGPDDLGIDS